MAGQARPAGGVLTALPTAPAAIAPALQGGMGGQTVVNVTFCNTTGGADTIFLSHAVNGAADTPAQYLISGQTLGANSTYVYTGTIYMAAGDVLRVKSGGGNVSFNAYSVVNP